jgi:hypothetical protein
MAQTPPPKLGALHVSRQRRSVLRMKRKRLSTRKKRDWYDYVMLLLALAGIVIPYLMAKGML